MTSFCTYAWRLSGFSQSAAGALAVNGDRLAFFSDNESMVVSLQEIKNLKYPWYYLGGGFKCTIGGQGYRFSLVLPNNGSYPDEATYEKITSFMGDSESANPGQFIERGAGRRLSEATTSVSEGRQNMREWRMFFDSIAR